ncbi:polysaccharide deacetylase family protein [Halobium salinum]|uniref:Polysaccharide deacetylase family protein n=1 Tax=Halobium salinum TaxID=1364940 RepID=A0ABD5PED5_9EURY|nr:polysaccharide deacetylase family protein [Halobium salinum]
MSSFRVNRRHYLRTAAAGISITALPSVSGQGSNGQLVFVYDDGPITDYSKAFPIHQEKNAPACVGAVVNLVKAEDDLDGEHLLEMEDAGWEILSHTMDHRALGPIEITRDISPGDEKIYVKTDLHAWNLGDTILISDENSEEVATVIGGESDQSGEYLLLENPVENSYSVENGAQERLTDDVLKTAIAESKNRLEEMGLEINNFVYPFGRHGPRSNEIIKDHYDGVANFNYQGLNPGQGIDPYEVGRSYYRKDKMSEERLKEFLDTVEEDGLLGMFAAHTWYQDLTEDRIRLAIQEAQKRDIEIVTLTEAFEDQGVLKSEFSPSESTTSTKDSSEENTSTSTSSSSTTDKPTSTKTADQSTSTTNSVEPTQTAEPRGSPQSPSSNTSELTSESTTAATPTTSQSTINNTSEPLARPDSTSSNNSDSNKGFFNNFVNWLTSLFK